jgi:hypothetical protein
MKRPWRKVISVQHFSRQQCCKSCYPEGKMVKLTRLTLECGHQVDVRETAFPPKRRRCHICQGKRIFTVPPIERVLTELAIQHNGAPAKFIDLNFIIVPEGAKFEDIQV